MTQQWTKFIFWFAVHFFSFSTPFRSLQTWRRRSWGATFLSQSQVAAWKTGVADGLGIRKDLSQFRQSLTGLTLFTLILSSIACYTALCVAVLLEDDYKKRKLCELRLYCDLLVQQVHSIRSAVVDNPIPDVQVGTLLLLPIPTLNWVFIFRKWTKVRHFWVRLVTLLFILWKTAFKWTLLRRLWDTRYHVQIRGPFSI